ncbi:hypothetical protein NKI12_09895 [Mesorhizobium australicum]|uniref:Uncharacterized protein n=1 Tax=Mesorhizobium australicum TaxID=536018 RepID=A0ACC6SXH3_9HYPH
MAQSVEKRLNDLLDRAMSLVTALDFMEADCDLEETADDELTLGWTASGPRGGMDNTDREADDAELEEGGDEHEPSLGWSIGIDQDVALRGGEKRMLRSSMANRTRAIRRNSQNTTENPPSFAYFARCLTVAGFSIWQAPERAW